MDLNLVWGKKVKEERYNFSVKSAAIWRQITAQKLQSPISKAHNIIAVKHIS